MKCIRCACRRGEIKPVPKAFYDIGEVEKTTDSLLWRALDAIQMKTAPLVLNGPSGPLGALAMLHGESGPRLMDQDGRVWARPLIDTWAGSAAKKWEDMTHTYSDWMECARCHVAEYLVKPSYTDEDLGEPTAPIDWKAMESMLCAKYKRREKYKEILNRKGISSSVKNALKRLIKTDR